MKPAAILRSFLLHAVAAAAATVVIALEVLVVYFMAAVVSDDPGGPMAPFMTVIFALLFGIATCGLIYLPASLAFQRFYRAREVSRWRAIGIFSLAILGLTAIFLAWRYRGGGPGIFAATFAIAWFIPSSSFAAYWLVVAPRQSRSLQASVNG